ncbi:hypothetical protein [Aegicerativicinus sediminis]|uniref:hypothetical protein n=1 Tax=Aegicerativicinus sediminis TaxID=2893202 RepID=UPI001E418800|nr:hypothetical protein [Aegicerativicinus sediminis]
MKQILFILILMIAYGGFSQNSPRNRKLFHFDNRGIKPDSVVVHIDSLTTQQLLNKMTVWAKTSKIKGCKIEVFSSFIGEDITIKGKCRNLIRSKNNSGINPIKTGKFTIELKVDFCCYTFQPQSFKYSNGLGVFNNMSIKENSISIFKNNGEIREGFQLFPSAIQNLFNMVEASLYYYLKTGEQLVFKYY